MAGRGGDIVKRRISVLLLVFFGLPGLSGDALLGQIPELMGPVSPNIVPPMAVPFGPGERLEYDVKLGFLGKRGEGFMQVGPLETVRGERTYHVTMAYRGGLLFAKVNDHFDSWIDVSNLVTLRSVENTNQVGQERYKHFEFYPESMSWERVDNGNTGDLATSEPLDQISFFYFARTLPLEIGEEYTLDRYFKESGNPVKLKVLRRDTVEVPAGTFSTVVVQPIIKTSGLFGEGGKAELYFTDDSRRLLVMMKSEIPLIGALSLHLRNITEGVPLTPVRNPPSPDPGDGAPGALP
jgi:hypothetical protein